MLVERGLENARVKLHFRDDNDKMLKEFRNNMSDLDKLKRDYIDAGGSDPDFLLNLENLKQYNLDSKPTVNSLFATNKEALLDNRSLSIFFLLFHELSFLLKALLDFNIFLFIV